MYIQYVYIYSMCIYIYLSVYIMITYISLQYIHCYSNSLHPRFCVSIIWVEIPVRNGNQQKIDIASLGLANPSSKQSPAKISTTKPSGWIYISSHLNQGDFWKIPQSKNQTPPLKGFISTWPSLAHHVQHFNASLLHQTACQLRRRPHIHILDLPPNAGYQSPPGWHYIFRIGNSELNLHLPLSLGGG